MMEAEPQSSSRATRLDVDSRASPDGYVTPGQQPEPPLPYRCRRHAASIGQSSTRLSSKYRCPGDSCRSGFPRSRKHRSPKRTFVALERLDTLHGSLQLPDGLLQLVEQEDGEILVAHRLDLTVGRPGNEPGHDLVDLFRDQAVLGRVLVARLTCPPVSRKVRPASAPLSGGPRGTDRCCSNGHSVRRQPGAGGRLRSLVGHSSAPGSRTRVIVAAATREGCSAWRCRTSDGRAAIPAGERAGEDGISKTPQHPSPDPFRHRLPVHRSPWSV